MSDDDTMGNWSDKSAAAILYEFIHVRGDLGEEYAQTWLARILQWKIDRGERERDEARAALARVIDELARWPTSHLTKAVHAAIRGDA